MSEPMEICAVALASELPEPNCVTCVLGPILLGGVRGMKLLVPSLLSSVPSSTVSVLPLRAETMPAMRSNPDPCTLLPASTWVAANDTLVDPVVETAVSSSLVGGVEPSARVSTPLVVVGVEPSAHVVVVVPFVPSESVDVVSVPNETAMTPELTDANFVKPAAPIDGTPLIS